MPVVGLPGNPVSAYVTFEEFVRPALLIMQGHTQLHKTTINARLLDGIENHGRRQFVRVIVERDDHGYTARLTGEQGSQLLTSLAKADGLAIISEHTVIMSSQAAKSRYRCSIGRRKGNAHAVYKSLSTTV